MTQRSATRHWIKAVAVGASAAAVLMTSACADNGGGGTAVDNMRIMVPNSPGGGYDTTARVAAKIMEDEDIVPSTEVFNLEGAGGTVGLARTVQSKGQDGQLMVMGLGLVGSVFTQKSEATLDDTTPIARLISEPDVVVVPGKSKYKTLDQLISAWKADPGNFPVGGGSSPGGPDHLAPHLLAQTVGIKPKSVNYVSYDGGGPELAALLNGEIKVGFSGVSEYRDQIDAGQLRVLAVTSAERVPGFDAPTLKEQGVDLDFVNWRGLVAPPGISADQKQALVDAVTELHDSPAWAKAEKANGWTDDFLTGKRFCNYIDDQNQRVKTVLNQLGLV